MKKNNTKVMNAMETFVRLSIAMNDPEHSYVRFVTKWPELVLRVESQRSGDYITSAFRKFLRDLFALADFLRITYMECLVFVAIYALEIRTSQPVDWRSICVFLRKDVVNDLSLRNHLANLLKKGVVCCENERKELAFKRYKVSNAVEEAMQDNKFPRKKKAQKKESNKALEVADIYFFCHKVACKLREEDFFGSMIVTTEGVQWLEEFENQNDNLPMVKELKSLTADIRERLTFYDMCNDFLNVSCRKTRLYGSLSVIYDYSSAAMKTLNIFLSGQHPLQTGGLVELCESQKKGESAARLTEKGRRLFLGDDYNLFPVGENPESDNNLLRPCDIEGKQLFFGGKTRMQLLDLQNGLMDDKLRELQERLGQKSMCKGVSVLMYGVPGTGKTESVRQLAKKTGRSLMQVDIASCRSKWYGESEQLLKGVFDTYRKLCQQEPLKPILLFNEADALFSKRRDADDSLGNGIRVENTLQNILLEEMERLDGILIATTNLPTSFDDAFSRRFLFKVQFEKPGPEEKKGMWKDTLSWLGEDDALWLAQRYDLSGGEIDNVVRKAEMEEVLRGNCPELKTLSEWCSEERFTRAESPKIGYVA